MTEPSIVPTRLWAVIRPDNDEVIGLRDCHRGEQACAAIASQLGWSCEAFHASWLPGARRAEEEGQADELIAADVTSFVSASASFKDVELVIHANESIFIERFIARRLD